MTIQNRFIADCRGENQQALDLASFVQRLILFETYVLKSRRLREIPEMVRSFGINGVISLLSSNALEIQLDPWNIVIAEQGSSTSRNSRRKTTSFGNFEIMAVSSGDWATHLGKCLSEIDQQVMADQGYKANLFQLLEQKLMPIGQSVGQQSLMQLGSDLQTNSESLRYAISSRMTEKLQRSVTPDSFTLIFIDCGQGKFRVETNLVDKLGISEHECYSGIKTGVLGLGELHRRIEEMSVFSALTAFNNLDSKILDYKLALMARLIEPEIKQETHFGRVVSIGELPLIQSGDTELDAEKLLRIRQSDECSVFRSWLASTESMSDEQLRSTVSGLSAKLTIFANSTKGKLIRFLVSSTVGSIPGVNTIANLGVGFIDAFIIEKLLPSHSAVTFIHERYPSIFLTRED